MGRRRSSSPQSRAVGACPHGRVSPSKYRPTVIDPPAKCAPSSIRSTTARGVQRVDKDGTARRHHADKRRPGLTEYLHENGVRRAYMLPTSRR